MKKIVFALAAVVLVSCGEKNPLTVEIPVTMRERVLDEEYTEAVAKLTSEQKSMLDGFIYMGQAVGEPVPENITIGEAIEVHSLTIHKMMFGGFDVE